MHRISSQIRRASTSTHPFPFPAHSHPTPWQIFHLPVGASQRDIKSRYYELVRVHHPDAMHCRNLSPAVRRARFQSITHAYDVLRGKRSQNTVLDPVMEELQRRSRYQHLRRTAYHDTGFGNEYSSGFAKRDFEASADDRWKDRVIIFVGVLTLGIGLFPAVMLGGPSNQTHLSAAANLAQARAEAREFGAERRIAIKKRVEEHRRRTSGQNRNDNTNDVP